jgi:hypothetical protein
MSSTSSTLTSATKAEKKAAKLAKQRDEYVEIFCHNEKVNYRSRINCTLEDINLHMASSVDLDYSQAYMAAYKRCKEWRYKNPGAEPSTYVEEYLTFKILIYHIADRWLVRKHFDPEIPYESSSLTKAVEGWMKSKLEDEKFSPIRLSTENEEFVSDEEEDEEEDKEERERKVNSSRPYQQGSLSAVISRLENEKKDADLAQFKLQQENAELKAASLMRSNLTQTFSLKSDNLNKIDLLCGHLEEFSNKSVVLKDMKGSKMLT